MKHIKNMKRSEYESRIVQCIENWQNSVSFPEKFAFIELAAFLGVPDGTCYWPKCKMYSPLKVGRPLNRAAGDDFFCHKHCPLCL